MNIKFITYRKMIIFVLLLSSLSIFSKALTKEVNQFIWQVNEVITPNIVIKRIQQHREFVRIYTLDAKVLSCTELTHSPEIFSDFKYRNFVIQDCPKSQSSDDLKKTILISLKTKIKNKSRLNKILYQIKIRKLGTDKINQPLSFYKTIRNAYYSVTHLRWIMTVILMLFLVLLTVASVKYLRIRYNVYWFLGVLVVLIFYNLFVRSFFDYVGYFNILHEGLTSQNIKHLYGEGVHAGEAFKAFYWENSLRFIINLNFILAIINSFVTFLLARFILRNSHYSFIFIFLPLLNTSFVSSAYSELPSQFIYILSEILLISIYFFRIKLYRRTVTLLTFLLVYCLYRIREEFAIIAIVPLWMIVQLMRLKIRYILSSRMISLFLIKFRFQIGIHKILYSVIAIIVIAILVFSNISLENKFEIRVIVATFDPLNVFFFSTGLFLFYLVPLTFVLLFYLGVYSLLKKSNFFILTLLIFILLDKLYIESSHSVFFERFRYISYLMFFIHFIFIRGLQFFMHKVSIFGNKKWLAVAIFFSGLFSMNSNSSLDQYGSKGKIYKQQPVLRIFSPTNHLIKKNVQREAEFLLNMIKNYRQCTFIAPVLHEYRSDKKIQEYLFQTFNGKKIDQEPMGFDNTHEYIARAKKMNQCLILYYGLDCNKEYQNSCPTLGASSEIKKIDFENEPFNDKQEYGKQKQHIQLRLLKIN